jgi:nucleoid DNA-binding protein
VEAMFEEVIRSLKKGDKVVLSGFGTFYVNKVNDKHVEPFGDIKLRDKSSKLISD